MAVNKWTLLIVLSLISGCTMVVVLMICIYFKLRGNSFSISGFATLTTEMTRPKLHSPGEVLETTPRVDITTNTTTVGSLTPTTNTSFNDGKLLDSQPFSQQHRELTTTIRMEKSYSEERRRASKQNFQASLKTKADAAFSLQTISTGLSPTVSPQKLTKTLNSATLTPGSLVRSPPLPIIKSVKKEEIKSSIKTSTQSSEPSQTLKSSKARPSTIQKVNLSQVSNLSIIKTSDLTEIYNLPSPIYEKADDIVQASGFRLGELLGRGSYASVYKAIRIADGAIFACKVMNIATPSQNQSLSLKSELFTMERMIHPNIIYLLRHFIVAYSNGRRSVYIFMQYAEGDSLSVHMRKGKRGQPEAICRRWFSQIISAIRHMHMKDIAHHDLKMGNILLDRELDCLVTDFGLSRIAYRKSQGGTILSHKFCGTVPYMAPEVLINRHYQLEYDPFMADVWAAGVVLYCIMNRGYPFNEGPGMYEQQIAHKIKLSGRMTFKPSPDLIELLDRVLDPDVAKRATIEELMASPWMKPDIDQVEAKAKAMIAGGGRKSPPFSKTFMTKTKKAKIKMFSPAVSTSPK